jgi:hypothetical protein
MGQSLWGVVRKDEDLEKGDARSMADRGFSNMALI